MGAGPFRSGRPPGWISIPILRNPWCGPCDGPRIVLICGKHWPAVRSASTVWKPYPGSPTTWDFSSIWMWPGCVGKQPTGSGSAAEDEYRTASDQFLILQPSLDESWWKGWFGMDGATGALVDKTISEKADDLPLLPDGSRGDCSWRKAMALAELCVTDDPPPAQLTVFVDTTQATPSNGEAGVVLEAGPRIGTRSPRSHPLRCGHRSHRPRRRRDPDGLRAETPGPSHPPYAGPSSTATATPAPATAVPAPTDSKSTTSSPGHKAEPPTPTI